MTENDKEIKRRIEQMENAFLEADLPAAREIMDKVREQFGFDALMFEVLEPSMIHLGELLERHEAFLAQTYVASMIVDEALKWREENIDLNKTSDDRLKGPIILGNIEDDCHPLGRKIVASFLRLNGWDVRDLGIDVEAKIFVDEAIKTGAKVIGVSAMIFTTAKNIRKVREEIDARGLNKDIKLIVGGAVFRLRPELVEEVGGDATVPNAFAAPPVFEKLWQEAAAERRNIA